MGTISGGEQRTLKHLSRHQGRVLHSLFDAVGNPAVWPLFLDQLVEATHSRSARLLILNGAADEVRHSFKVHIDDAAHRDYLDHYVNACPWRPELRHKPGGRLYSTYLDFSCRQPEFYRTEFYNDWARHLDIHHGVCGTVHAGPDLTVQLLIQRTGGQRHYSARETAAINTLIPHLRQAITLSRHLDAMNLELQATRVAARHGAPPFLVLDAQGLVRAASAGAVALVEQTPALALRQNQLRIMDRQLSDHFRQRLRRARTSKAAAAPPPPQTIRIPRPAQPPLHLIIAHLEPDRANMSLTLPDGHAVVFLHDPQHPPDLDLGLLTELFDLTAAEARTAAGIATGMTPEDIARDLGITVHTVRSQLKSTFRKTGTRRQSELAALLLTGPAARRAVAQGASGDNPAR